MDLRIASTCVTAWPGLQTCIHWPNPTRSMQTTDHSWLEFRCLRASYIYKYLIQLLTVSPQGPSDHCNVVIVTLP